MACSWSPWLLILSLCLSSSFLPHYHYYCQAYVSFPQAVPRQKQLQWLKQMTNDFTQQSPGQLTPEQLTMAPHLMHAWSHDPSKTTEKAHALESLLKRLIDERPYSTLIDPLLTVDAYNGLLQAWATAGTHPATAERCEQILQAMHMHETMQPNIQSYKAVLSAWRNVDCPWAPERAQQILETLVDNARSNENNDDDDGSTTTSAILPDSDCFDIVLQAWSRSGRADAPQHSEALLGTMERLYEATGWAQVKPRTSSFNAVLATWSRSTHPLAATRACEILSFMQFLEQGDSSVAPDTASYCTVMNALCRMSSSSATSLGNNNLKHPAASLVDPVVAYQVEGLLRHVEARFHETASPKLIPDSVLFNTAMGSWAKTYNMSGAFRKAWAILERQMYLYEHMFDRPDVGNIKHFSPFFKRKIQACCRPDVVGFTSVIASCAAESGTPDEQTQAFYVALFTLYHMEQRYGIPPNHITYGNMLKCTAHLLAGKAHAKKRTKYALQFFAKARDAGCVGDMVLKRARESLGKALFEQACLQGHSPHDLPASWTRELPPALLAKNEQRRQWNKGNKNKQRNIKTSEGHHQHHPKRRSYTAKRRGSV